LLWDQPAKCKTYSEKTGIRHFDAIDGNDVTNAKPDPEVFLIAAKLLDVNPRMRFFEDSVAGVQAANIGNDEHRNREESILYEAKYVFDFTQIEKTYTDFNRSPTPK
jgi:beta-phosphoglucomutase